MSRLDRLIKKLEAQLQSAADHAISEGARLQDRIEALEAERDSFKRMVMMPGQDMALRLMDAETSIEALEAALRDMWRDPPNPNKSELWLWDYPQHRKLIEGLDHE